MSDHENTYNDFWRDIVVNPDGTLNIDQIKRELHDYAGIMDQASKVYDEITGSRISKPNADASSVISAANECTQEWLDDRMTELTKDIIEVFENAADDATPQEIREELFDALGITES